MSKVNPIFPCPKSAPVSSERVASVRALARSFALGRFAFDRPVFLAPMSGVTDLPFRRIAAQHGADVVVTEMVASESLTAGDDEMRLRMAGEGMSPHVVQLAGREAHWMAEAARMAEANGADIIDINMGCPAKRVTTGWSGAALMRDLDHALTLIEATVGAVSVPVTLKMRLGWDRGSINAPELARRAEDAGVQLVTVHGRTRDQFYEGSADWHAIRAVREATRLPLVANGDIESFEDALVILERSGADAVMIGRGAQGRPWFPGQVSRFLKGAAPEAGPDAVALGALVAGHYAAMLDHYGIPKGLRAARKHIAWYLDRFEAETGAETPLRAPLLTSTDPATVLALIREAFADGNTRRAA
jgi:tRNA-dihydrouridine synthase B